MVGWGRAKIHSELKVADQLPHACSLANAYFFSSKSVRHTHSIYVSGTPRSSKENRFSKGNLFPLNLKKEKKEKKETKRAKINRDFEKRIMEERKSDQLFLNSQLWSEEYRFHSLA